MDLKTSQTIDQTVWQSYRKGDKNALGQLAERYYRTLRHYGLKFMVDGSIVEDCIQELFLQLWQNRAHINDTESVKHYLLKSLRNHILQYIRSQQRVTFQEPDWDIAPPEDVDIETLMIRQESLAILSNTIQSQLPTLLRKSVYPRDRRGHGREPPVGFQFPAKGTHQAAHKVAGTLHLYNLFFP